MLSSTTNNWLTSNRLTPSALLFAGAVPFGSRALDVNIPSSDYDFAILDTNYYNLLGTEEYARVSLENYFKVIPPKKSFAVLNVPINTNEKVDLLVVTEQGYLTTIKEAVKYLKDNYRKDILQDRKLRIRLYEAELLHRGFIKTNRT